MTVGLSCWCASPRVTVSLLFVSTWTQPESAVRRTCAPHHPIDSLQDKRRLPESASDRACE